MHKPIHTLLFLSSTIVVLGTISLVYPKDGIKLTESISLKYPTYSELFPSEKPLKKDISKIIALADVEEKEGVPVKNDSIIEVVLTPTDSLAKLNTSIQYYDAGKSAMANFFNSLANISNEPKSIRVLHYGDSQIEGDRISDYLRLKLQAQFGGEGPGLISFMPVAPSVINKLSWSPTWDRYTIFTGKDKRVKHNNFGALAHITRFSKYNVLSDSTQYKSAWVKMVTSKNGGPKAAGYNKLKLYYGGSQAKTHVELYENGSLNNSDSLLAGGNFNIKEFNLI